MRWLAKNEAIELWVRGIVLVEEPLCDEGIPEGVQRGSGNRLDRQGGWMLWREGWTGSQVGNDRETSGRACTTIIPRPENSEKWSQPQKSSRREKDNRTGSVRAKDDSVPGRAGEIGCS